MSLEDNKIVVFYKAHSKGIHAIEGLLIVLLLVGLNYLAFVNSGLNKEIKENCGWGEDDYFCYCDKSTASELKNRLDLEVGGDINLTLLPSGDYDGLDR